MNLFSPHLNKTIFSLLCIVIFLYLVKSREQFQFSDVVKTHEHDGHGVHHHHLQSCDNGQPRLHTEQQSHSSGRFGNYGQRTEASGEQSQIGGGDNSQIGGQQFRGGDSTLTGGNTSAQGGTGTGGNATVTITQTFPYQNPIDQEAKDGLEAAGIKDDVRELTEQDIKGIRLETFNTMKEEIQTLNEKLITKYDEALTAVNTEIDNMNNKINRDGIKPLEEENKAKQKEIKSLKEKKIT